MPTAPTVLFSVADARAFDKKQLASAADYTDAAITTAEAGIRSDFARWCGVQFIPTTTTEVRDGTGTHEITLYCHNPYSETPARGVTLTSITYTPLGGTPTAFTAPELADVACYPDRLVRKSLGWFPVGYRNVSIVYTHGYAAVPEDIKRAALITCLRQLQPSDVGFEATSGAEWGINWTRNPDPTRQRWTGIEQVDGVLRSYWMREMPL